MGQLHFCRWELVSAGFFFLVLFWLEFSVLLFEVRLDLL